MTIKERMTARTEREKDLLKFGRGQGRKQEQERIIKLLEGLMNFETDTQRRIDHKLALEVLKDALINGEN